MKGNWNLDDDSTSLISCENTVKKRKKEIDLYIVEGGQNSISKTPEGYAKYIADSLNSSPQSVSLRGFTLTKTAQSKNRNKKLNNIKYHRSDDIKPFRKYTVAGWKDNYYTNLLDWSQNYLVYTGYQNQLNLYNISIYQEGEKSANCRKIPISIDGQNLTSLKTSPTDSKVALGYSNGSLRIYDCEKQKAVQTWHYHILRIAALQWENDLIISGSKDQHLKLLDPRTKQLVQIERDLEKAHIQQVCGVKKKGNYVASGGNDNKVYIYDIRKQAQLHSYWHNAAVKAITWIDNKNIATGGGTADKSIKIFSMNNNSIKTIDTGSQVCSLCWAKSTQQLISCQGFSLNQIIVWSKNYQRQFTFHGHSTRVLYSAISPDQKYLASGAGDQNLKIWKIFPSTDSKTKLNDEQIR